MTTCSKCGSELIQRVHGTNWGIDGILHDNQRCLTVQLANILHDNQLCLTVQLAKVTRERDEAIAALEQAAQVIEILRGKTLVMR
jgi:hypothetical protein